MDGLSGREGYNYTTRPGGRIAGMLGFVPSEHIGSSWHDTDRRLLGFGASWNGAGQIFENEEGGFFLDEGEGVEAH